MSDQGRPTRTIASFRGAAIDYVEAQLAIMRKYGSEPRVLSAEEYNSLVFEVEEVGKKLWQNSGGAARVTEQIVSYRERTKAAHDFLKAKGISNPTLLEYGKTIQDMPAGTDALTYFTEFAESQIAELTTKLQRYEALEAHLPPMFAIGDDATAELALEIAELTRQREQERTTCKQACDALNQALASREREKETAESLRAELEQAREALRKIAELDAATDSVDGWNEWGESECFHKAKDMAKTALSRKENQDAQIFD